MRATVKLYRTEEEFKKDVPRGKKNFNSIDEALSEAKKRVAKARKEDRDVGFKIFDRKGNLRYKLPYFY